MKYIATISGGKDSVTMCDLLLKNGYPVDHILFTDTLMEFPMMYDYIEKVRKYFKERYNKDIEILKPKTTFEAWCFGVINDKNAKMDGFIRGIPHPLDGMCYHRRETKVKPQELFIKNEETTFYIGYTLKENRSMKDTEDIKYLFPLKTNFKMTEDDCKKYLIDQEMENPLYRFFSRTGCGMCPFQSERAMYEVYNNFKDTWEYMKWIEKRLTQYENMGMKVANKYWFSNFRTCEDMENIFNKTAKGFFDLNTEPLKDCFCKI